MWTHTSRVVILLTAFEHSDIAGYVPTEIIQKGKEK